MDGTPDSTATPPPALPPRIRPSITDVARRDHACALALAQTFHISLEEVLDERREICTAVFMQASREGIRLASRVDLPPLHGAGLWLPGTPPLGIPRLGVSQPPLPPAAPSEAA